jgi:uroporphyrinogen-III synthase
LRVWVARPEPGATRTGAALAARGHTALVAPVLVVRPTGDAPPAGPFDALLLTSAQAVPAVRDVPALRHLPVFAVGERTADAASRAGLGPVQVGPGDAGGLANLVAETLAPEARLLHAAGATRKDEPAATLLAAGFRVTRFVAYAAEALHHLPDSADHALARGDLDAVLHYSRRSAVVALGLSDVAGHGGAFRRLRHYCLSADVAAPLEAAEVPVHFVAARPREADLLDALGSHPHEGCGDREAGPPYLALAPRAAAVLGRRGDAEELEDLPVTPPPSDADKPGSGGRKPDLAPGKSGQPGAPQQPGRPGGPSSAAPGTGRPTTPGASEAGKSPVPGAGAPPKPATEPVVSAKPGTTDAKPEAGKPGSAATPPGQAATGKSEPAKPDSASSINPRSELPASEASKAGASTTGASTPPDARAAASAATAAGIKTEPGKPETRTSEPPKPGQPGAGPSSGPGAGQQSGPRPGATGAAGAAAASAVTAGPIIDLKAKRVPDSPGPGRETQGGAPKDAAKDASKDSKDTPRGPVPGVTSTATPKAETPRTAAPAAARTGAGFGSIAAAGLLGGVIGAGLLFGAEKAGIGPDPRLNALDQKLSGQIAALDKRVEGFASRDALTALDKRIASAEATAKQALDKAGAAPAPAAGSPDGQASAQAPAVPADLVARLDSLDQRVAALQEEPGREPGRDQPADAKLNAVQDSGQQLASIDARLKALEEGGNKGAADDASQKLAALQNEVAQKTKANADADTALGQRLDALQQALDQRVKAATEAVQAATQASRTAAEAGQAQAAEATKAVDRRLQEQADRIAALDKSVAQRAEAGTVQAALRVVVVDRVASALESGAPYAEPLATLRKLDPSADAQAQALAPFAETGAPTAAQLADDFRPIASAITAKRQAQRAKSAAETGDFRAKLLSMADGLVQVRKVDAPAPEASDAPEAKVQAALDRGDLPAASAAFAALPAEARDQAGDFGAKLKARAEAETAVRTLLDGAFKALPTQAAASGR